MMRTGSVVCKYYEGSFSIVVNFIYICFFLFINRNTRIIKVFFFNVGSYILIGQTRKDSNYKTYLPVVWNRVIDFRKSKNYY